MVSVFISSPCITTSFIPRNAIVSPTKRPTTIFFRITTRKGGIPKKTCLATIIISPIAHIRISIPCAFIIVVASTALRRAIALTLVDITAAGICVIDHIIAVIINPIRALRRRRLAAGSRPLAVAAGIAIALVYTPYTAAWIGALPVAGIACVCRRGASHGPAIIAIEMSTIPDISVLIDPIIIDAEQRSVHALASATVDSRGNAIIITIIELVGLAVVREAVAVGVADSAVRRRLPYLAIATVIRITGIPLAPSLSRRFHKPLATVGSIVVR